MPFDANLVLADSTADWTYANLVTNVYGAPTSTNKNAGGFVVVDLLALSGTGAKGMAAVFIGDEAAAAADDALTLIIEGSDQSDFTSELEALCAFAVDGAVGSGIIDGDEVPCTIVRRFQTERRYIRAKATCVSGDDFKTCHVLLAPWPFYFL